MSTPEPSIDLSAGLATSIQKGPDGKDWVVLHIQTPLLQAAWWMPDDAATKLADQLPEILRTTAAVARRANLGLALPTLNNGVPK